MNMNEDYWRQTITDARGTGAVQKLTPALRHYPWGSRTLLGELRGLPTPTQSPEAELWYGAHPAASSTVDGRALTTIIAEDPLAALGARVSEAYAGKLPFLVKLLAADEPLSLQAHPSAEQAQAGYDRENEAGIALDAGNRNYKDPSHKPEIIVALTDFAALAGFRPFERTRELLDALDCSALEHYLSMLSDDPAEEDSNLRVLFTTWITIPASARVALVRDVVEAAQAWLDAHPEPGWMHDALAAVVDLDDRYPGDVGVLGALLLNHIRLQPGDALYLSAGQLHAYLYGMGVEVMANSDNVLRGGLTSKHVDVPELVRVLRFESLADPGVRRDGREYDLPIDEFRLAEYSPVVDVVHRHDGPAIALCTAGRIQVDGDTMLTPGDSLWLPACGEPVHFRDADEEGATPAQLFIART
ncbi:Mannose-6-phosphate isomerase [Corynebacterium guangdongense]|nr:Mannose-6-phosphate isomerase [Corynebacterium guangdongense]